MSKLEHYREAAKHLEAALKDDTECRRRIVEIISESLRLCPQGELTDRQENAVQSAINTLFACRDFLGDDEVRYIAKRLQDAGFKLTVGGEEE